MSSSVSPVATSPQPCSSNESTSPKQELVCQFTQVREVIDGLGFDYESLGLVEGLPLLSECNTEVQVIAPQGYTTLCSISASSQGKQKSWLLNYSVISFLMNGQLFSEYDRISNMLGLPHCSN